MACSSTQFLEPSPRWNIRHRSDVPQRIVPVATRNRGCKGGAAKHGTFRGSRPPFGRGPGREDTAGGDIPPCRKRMQEWILDRWLSNWPGTAPPIVQLPPDVFPDKHCARCVRRVAQLRAVRWLLWQRRRLCLKRQRAEEEVELRKNYNSNYMFVIRNC